MSLITHIDHRTKMALLSEVRQKIVKVNDKDRVKEEAEQSLLAFIRLMWPFVEPSRPLVEGWPLEAIVEHLEAVTSGEIKRLLINVPPGFMKSLVANVFWPAWEWIEDPSLRYISASYQQSLTTRDNTRLRNIITSHVFKEFWGDRFNSLNGNDAYNVIKLENNKTGWKIATSVDGVGTGERGDRFVIDDGNSVKQAESQAITLTTNQWFREVVPTRVNDPLLSAIINIQQRTSENDISGIILDPDNGLVDDYVHLMIPMEYEPDRHCVTVIGWEDPRGADPETRHDNAGALAWSKRFPREVVERDKKPLGEYGVAGQFQQRPAPRGGGIFKREHWQVWPPEDWPADARVERVNFPPLDYVCASLDTALSQKEEADYSALTIWGIWRGVGGGKTRLPPRIVIDPETDFMRLDEAERPKCMLLYGWQKRLRLHGPTEVVPPGMSAKEWMDPLRLAERQKHWGLVQWVVYHCRMYKIDQLLIEVKTRGQDVAEELHRLHKDEDWGTILVDPGAFDKVSRAYALQHLFENGIVYAPMIYSVKDDIWNWTNWASPIVDQFSIFPRGKHDDLVDSGMHALKHMRDLGLLIRSDEAERNYDREIQYRRPQVALYPA